MPTTVARLLAAGATVVDARSFVAFGAGHLPGSISNTLRPVFGSWLGWLVASDTPIVFVLDADQDRSDLVRQCLDVGHERLLGELDGGVIAWTASGRPLATIPVVGAEQLHGTVIDVRQANEYDAGHLPEARNVELGSIPTTPSWSDEPVTVMCGHGERAMSAASLLTASRHRHPGVRRRPRHLGRRNRRNVGGRTMSATAPTESGIRLGLRENLAQFALLVGVNALVGGMIGQERTVLPLLADRRVRARQVHRHAHLHRRVRHRQSRHQLLRRHPLRPLRPQTRPRRRLDHRRPRPPPADVGTHLGMGGVRQRPARRQPRPHLVDHGHHEDRPRRPRPTRFRHGAQRSRRLRRCRRHRPRHRLDRRRTRPAPSAVLPRPRLRRARPRPVHPRRAGDPCPRPPRSHQPHADQRHPPRRVDDREIFRLTSFRDRALSSCSQAGLVNNLNDGLAWGLFPIFFAAAGISVGRIGILAALYPAAWGLGQLYTGGLSDRIGRKPLIAGGMLTQAVALAWMAAVSGFWAWAAGAVVLGVGTAMVYPTLLAAIGDVAHPTWRARSVGVYRLWRDGGFAVGALLAGTLADLASIETADLRRRCSDRLLRGDRGRPHARDPPTGPPMSARHASRRSIDDLLAEARARLDRVEPSALAAEFAAGAVVIDIRPVEQRTRDGAVPSAIVIDRNVLEWRLDPASEHRIAEIGGYDTRIVIVCNEGYQSSLVAAELRMLGLHRATDLIGGFQAWIGEAVPMTTSNADDTRIRATRRGLRRRRHVAWRARLLGRCPSRPATLLAVRHHPRIGP